MDVVGADVEESSKHGWLGVGGVANSCYGGVLTVLTLRSEVGVSNDWRQLVGTAIYT